jgi:hypothetical protein
MIYMVEVRSGGRLAHLMAEMRTWLDHDRIEPELFQHSGEGTDVTFRVGFSVEGHAAAFAKAFGGRLRICRPAPSHPVRRRITS